MGKADEEEENMGTIWGTIDDQCTTIQIPTAYPWCCRPRTRNRRVPATEGGYLTQTIWQSRRPSHWELECDTRGLLVVSPVLGSVPHLRKANIQQAKGVGTARTGKRRQRHTGQTTTRNKNRTGQREDGRRRTSNTREHTTRQEVSSQFSFVLTILPLGAAAPFGLPALISRGA